MFYLKYRPRTIGEIDNVEAAETIAKILESEKIPHALLFIGQKGTGKTSTARIFAKAINCLNKKGIEPCNKCANCRSIDSSSSVDVIEMDAASNRGIDEIRSLIKETSFVPMTNKYRVFIIDEAHMITPDAFNALLKTLEEPPESVIFILATTAREKIPKTIASRCFTINFGKAKAKDVVKMLQRICKSEKISVDDNVLTLVVAHSDNSFRDAAKILEEIIIQKKLNIEEAEKFLGLVGKQNLLSVLESSDIKQALTWIEEFEQGGGNVKNLIEQILSNLRVLLLAKHGVINEQEIKSSFSTLQIMTLMKLFTIAYDNLKKTPIESIALELAVADFYNKGKEV